MKQLFRYFVRGCLAIAPLAATLFIIYQGFMIIDQWLGLQIPGLGFVITLALITLVACFGFAGLYSAAGGGFSPWAAPQMVRFFAGLLLLLTIACVDLRVWMGIAYPAYAVSVLLLVAVELAGRVGMGAQRWLELGPLALQPSEPMKITLILALARYLHGLGPDDVSRPLRLFAPLLMILAPAVLVLMQPNLGTATLLMVGGAMLLFLAGLSWRWIASTAVAVAVAIPSAWFFLLHDYQKQRVLTFINPDADALGAGWNTAQAKIALGSGGLLGKGFLMGGTAGRTTLHGEGLQHQDGHSHVLASTVPTVTAYDPAFAYETAVIVQDGIRRMYELQEDRFYYITMYNENYPQPPRPEGVEEGLLRGLYRFRAAPDLGSKAHGVRLLGSGAILQQVIAAAELLAERFGIAAEVWSAPSFQLLRRDALEVERWNRLHPDRKAKVPYVSQSLPDDGRPIVATTDWLKAVPDMVARWLPPSYVSLGTDGFGRSDNRDALRAFFEIDPPHVAVAALLELARCGSMPAAKVSKAIRDLGIDPEKASPLGL